MSDDGMTTEERILRVMRHVLTSVARDTATEPGMRHPLSEGTVADIRDCLVLISERERELVDARGGPTDARPRYMDEPRPQGDVVVSINDVRRPSKEK